MCDHNSNQSGQPEPESLPRRHTDPAWLHDYFLGTGRDVSTRTGTFTFVKRHGRHYAVTCRHIAKAVSNPAMVPNARNPTLAIDIDRMVLNLSHFTAKGLAPAIKAPHADTERDEIDVAIAPLDGSFWPLLADRKNKFAIDLDAWQEPDWSSVKWCLAAGYPDEHKTGVMHDGTDKISSPLFVVVAEATSHLGRDERYITLSSTLEKPHGYYFSGMSGGPVYATEGAEQRTVADDELFPVGLIFEGFPSSGRPQAERSRDAASAFLTGNDLFFRAF